MRFGSVIWVNHLASHPLIGSVNFYHSWLIHVRLFFKRNSFALSLKTALSLFSINVFPEVIITRLKLWKTCFDNCIQASLEMPFESYCYQSMHIRATCSEVCLGRKTVCSLMFFLLSKCSVRTYSSAHRWYIGALIFFFDHFLFGSGFPQEVQNYMFC